MQTTLVSSSIQDLTLSSMAMYRHLHHLHHHHLHLVVALTLPIGMIANLRHAMISTPKGGAPPAEEQVLTGIITGETSLIIPTAMAIQLWMHAVLVVVVPTTSSCES